MADISSPNIPYSLDAILEKRDEIPWSTVDGSSTRSQIKATVPEIDQLKTGICCVLWNNTVVSEANWTLNINNLGAKPVYLYREDNVRSTTDLLLNYTFLFIYNEVRVVGGCWDIIDFASISEETPDSGAAEIDYRNLTHKPRINGVELLEDKTLNELGINIPIYSNTTEDWDLQIGLISEYKAIYIYENKNIIYDESDNPIYVPGIKVGDGLAYLIDLPFVTDAVADTILKHISNTDVHVSMNEKTKWNHKVSAFMDPIYDEVLVLSKTRYEVNGTIIDEET